MKIKLLTFSAELNDIYINTTVVLRSPRKILPVSAMIDTGSPVTMLGYGEAIQLQIPFESLNKDKFVEIGGGNNESRVFNKLKILLKSEDGRRIEETMPVYIIKPTSPKKKQTFTFIIGTDFLKNKGYTLFCDLKNDNAYLEKEDAA
jgi:hypothetical protein